MGENNLTQFYNALKQYDGIGKIRLYERANYIKVDLYSKSHERRTQIDIIVETQKMMNIEAKLTPEFGKILPSKLIIEVGE